MTLFFLFFYRNFFRFCGKSTGLWSRFVTSGMSGEPAAKKALTMVKIGTHNGTFHCDEVLACFMLKQLPRYKDAEIIR